MTLLALAFVLAATPPPIRGGTPQQRAELQRLLEQVPECLRNANGSPVDVRIAGGEGNDRESEESRAEFNAGYEEGEGRRRPTVSVNQSLFEPHYCNAMRAAATTMCGDEETLRRGMRPLAFLTHEFAHHFHLRGTYRDSQGRVRSNRALIDQFLSIKWRAARRAAQRDPEVRRLQREIARMEAMRPPRGPNAARIAAERREAYCRAVAALDEKMHQHGFPARFPGDGPYGASDRDGAEYFAVALETLIFHPEVFSRAYSAEEQAWLAQHFGECLATFPALAQSYRERAAAIRRSAPGTTRPAEGAGTRRK
jgi:hypothetical protein